MKHTVIVIGVGEMGGVFARGFLRSGHPVMPVTRATDIARVADAYPEPELVLVAVGESDLQPMLQSLPAAWRSCVTLLQNELLPRDWQRHGLDRATVMSVWFEKKKGMDAKVVLPSPVWGPKAHGMVEALAALDIPAREVDSLDEMTFELVRKNVYILTTNIAGLVVGGTVSELWSQHEALARDVVNDVLAIQEYLLGGPVPRDRLLAGMLEAFEGDPAHKCMGRSAPARLKRALAIADKAGLAVPKLREIEQQAA
jgi:ketopantoate reductase